MARFTNTPYPRRPHGSVGARMVGVRLSAVNCRGDRMCHGGLTSAAGQSAASVELGYLSLHCSPPGCIRARQPLAANAGQRLIEPAANQVWTPGEGVMCRAGQDARSATCMDARVPRAQDAHERPGQ